MTTLKTRAGLALAGLALLGTARAELVEIRWDAAGRFEHAQILAPGQFAEVCGRLGKGRAIAWSFKSSQPTVFNIHYHEGCKVEYPARFEGARSAEGLLMPALDQDYCWMWSNPTGASAELTLSLQRQP